MSLTDNDLSALQKKAEAGDADAQFELANALYPSQIDDKWGWGRYFNVDTKYISPILDMSAEIFASNNVEKSYCDATKKYFTESLYWYRKAAEQGHAEAQFALGECYDAGCGVYRNEYIAFACFKKVAMNGNIDAQYRLATCYEFGRGVELNEEKAFAWYLKLAEQGYISAQREVVNRYRDGIGVKQNNEQAIEWDEKRKNQTNTSSNVEKIKVHEEKDTIATYEQATEQDDVEAQYLLAITYEESIDCSPNEEQALVWHPKAPKKDKVKAKAIKEWEVFYLENRADTDSPDAAIPCQLGVAYYTGNGVVQNHQKSIRIFQDMLEYGIDYNHIARFMLGHAYYYGHGVTINKRLALEYIEGDKLEEGGKRTFVIELFMAYVNYKDDKQEWEDWLNRAAFTLSIKDLVLLKTEDVYLDDYDDDECFLINTLIFFDEAEDIVNFLQHANTESADNIIAFFYYKGIIVNRNTQKAFKIIGENRHPSDIIQYNKAIMYLDSEELYEAKEIFVNLLAQYNTPRKQFENRCYEYENDTEGYIEKALLSSSIQNHLKTIVVKEKNKELEEKNKELNNLIAMFAHNFLGTLQCIRSNAEHENNPTIHLKTVKMMSGALTAFSIISADDDKLIEQLKQDNSGETTLLQNLANNLALAVSQLLSKTNKDKIINIYLNYLQKMAKIKPETNGEELRENRDYRKKWQALQHQWEDEFNALFSEKVEISHLQTWLETNFFPIEITGFNDYNIRFKEYGITDSIFLVVFMEILVNALKYMDVGKNKPLTITLCKENQTYQLTCENPSAQESYRGTHKGMDFLKSLARKVNGQFITESTEQSFKSTFIILAELLE